MIDLHCHILPGIDDGPKAISESLEMLKIAVSEGIKVMVATPHWMEGSRFTPSVDLLQERLSQLRALSEENNVKIQILLGMEIAISPSIPERLEKGQLLPLAGSKYLLLEAPVSYLPEFFEHVVFEVMTMGYTPVLAHPERCVAFQEDPSRLIPLWKRGVLFQLDTDSLKGRFGERAYELAMYILKKGMAFAVSTDCHSAEKRKPTVLRLMDVLKKQLGQSLVEEVFYLNPRRVLQNTA